MKMKFNLNVVINASIVNYLHQREYLGKLLLFCILLCDRKQDDMIMNMIENIQSLPSFSNSLSNLLLHHVNSRFITSFNCQIQNTKKALVLTPRHITILKLKSTYYPHGTVNGIRLRAVHVILKLMNFLFDSSNEKLQLHNFIELQFNEYFLSRCLRPFYTNLDVILS